MKSGDTPRAPVGIWIRVSTEDQANGESPKHHEERARGYALSKGWEVVEVYHLEGVSGKSVMEHPEALRMLEDVESGRITALIFSKLARLARNTRELLDFADKFRAADASMVSLQEAIDTSTPAGRLFYTIIAAMAEWEREEISERVAASVPIRAKLGKSVGGAAPFGYQWEGGKMIPAPAEAPIRRKIYEVYLEERRLKTTAKRLNDAGHRTRKGGKFTDTTVRRLIEDTTAKGVRIANRTKSLGDKRHWELKPKAEWVTVPVEAIVDEALWTQCNELLDQATTRRGGQRQGRKPKRLFAGFLFCECGGKMSVPTKSKKYVCPDCRNKIGVDDLEEIYRNELSQFLVAKEDIEKQLQKAQAYRGKQQELARTLRSDLLAVERQIDSIFTLHSDGKIGGDQFKERNDPLSRRRKELMGEIGRVQGELDLLAVDVQSAELLSEKGVELSERWPDLDWDERRAVIENITDRIEVGRGRIAINLYYLPLLKDLTAKQRNDTGSWRRPA